MKSKPKTRFMWTDELILLALKEKKNRRLHTVISKMVGCSVRQLEAKFAKLKSGIDATPLHPNYKIHKCSKCGTTVQLPKGNFICDTCKLSADWKGGDAFSGGGLV